MYKCDICGRKMTKKNKVYGMNLCSKHMHQYHKYHKFLDNNPRTEKDLNEFRFLDKSTVEFDVYNIKSEKVNSFIIDAEDLQKVRYHKWRIDSNNRIVTGNCTQKNPKREISRFILDINSRDVVVDHISGNSLDNRKQNLRMCTQTDNVCNKSRNNSSSGYNGVYYDKNRRKWGPEIVKNSKRYHLGRYNNLKDAVYARYIAETILFKECRNTNRDEELQKMFDDIDDLTKAKIKNYICNKLQQNEIKLCA